MKIKKTNVPKTTRNFWPISPVTRVKQSKKLYSRAKSKNQLIFD